MFMHNIMHILKGQLFYYIFMQFIIGKYAESY